MPKAIENIRVFRIAQTTVNQDAVRAWLTDLGADQFVDELDCGAFDEISDPAFLVALAAKQCYMAFQPSLNPNLTKVRRDLVEYLDNVLSQRHGSVLEHAVFTYGINGCSRVFTGENNRHRAGTGISERSMRFVRYTNIEYWVPPCFRDDEALTQAERQKRADSRLLLQDQFVNMEIAMSKFTQIWDEELTGPDFKIKKVLTSAFRRVIGMGVATGGVWSGNARAFRHMLALRTDPSAEEEIVEVYRQIGDDLVKTIPELFGDFDVVDGAYVPKYPGV